MIKELFEFLMNYLYYFIQFLAALILFLVSELVLKLLSLKLMWEHLIYMLLSSHFASTVVVAILLGGTIAVIIFYIKNK